MYKNIALLILLTSHSATYTANNKLTKRAIPTGERDLKSNTFHANQDMLKKKSSIPKKRSPLGTTSLTANDVLSRLEANKPPVLRPETILEHNNRIIENFRMKKSLNVFDKKPYLANEDLESYIENSEWIIYDQLQKVECQIITRKTDIVRHIYLDQDWKIGNLNYELNGPLGGMLLRINEVNKKLIGCRWVCRCKTNSPSLFLKSELGGGDIKTLCVPTDRCFDLTLEKRDDRYYLTVYESPDEDGFELVSTLVPDHYS